MAKKIDLGTSLLDYKGSVFGSDLKQQDRNRFVGFANQFLDKFMSDFLINIPATQKKEYITTNLNNETFNNKMYEANQEQKLKNVNQRQKEIDLINSAENRAEGVEKIVLNNFYNTDVGQKFKDLGGIEAFKKNPVAKNKAIVEAYQNFVNSEVERLTPFYDKLIDENVISDIPLNISRLSNDRRNAVFASVYDKADLSFGLEGLINSSTRTNAGTVGKYEYLVDKAEEEFNKYINTVNEVTNFETLKNIDELKESLLDTPYVPNINRYSPFKKEIVRREANNKLSDAQEAVFTVQPNLQLIKLSKDGNTFSPSLLSQSELQTLRDDGNFETELFNIVEGYNVGYYSGKIKPTGEFREKYYAEIPGLEQRSIDEPQERGEGYVVRKKISDNQGNVSFQGENISIESAFANDVPIIAEFYRQRDIDPRTNRAVNEDVPFYYEKIAADHLIKSGNIYIKDNLLYYDRPMDALDLSNVKDFSSGVNESDYIKSSMGKAKNKSNDVLSSDEFLNSSIGFKINSLKQQVGTEDKITELDNLETPQEISREFLINLSMPPQELKNKIVTYGNMDYMAGDLSDEDRDMLYDSYINQFNQGRDDMFLKTIMFRR